MSDYITRHLGKRLVNKLARKGIRVIDSVTGKIEYPNGSTNYEVIGWSIDDNGTGRIRTREQLEAMA